MTRMYPTWRQLAAIAQPVDDVVALYEPEGAVDEAVHRCVLQFPDEPHHDQRQHHGQEEDALVDPCATHLVVEQDGQEHPERGGDEGEEAEPHEVVQQRGPEEQVARKEHLIVAQTDEVVGRGRPDAVPVGEGERHGGQRRAPDEREVEGERDPDHQREDEPVLARQRAVPAPPQGNVLRRSGRAARRGFSH
jgi:hypothetical protein